MQLLKYIQAQGSGSHKQCQWLIDNGRIAISGEVRGDAKSSIKPEEVETLAIDGEPIFAMPLLYFYMLFNRFVNYEISYKPQQYPSVFSLFPNHTHNIGMWAVGRLDVGTTGVLLITNDGQSNHRVTSPKHKVPKLYRATLKHAADNRLCEMLKNGVLLHDDNETIAADEAVLERSTVLLMTITEDEYHQIKRMVTVAGNRVERLHRERFGDWSADDLSSGSWRFIRVQEIFNLLNKFVKYSVLLIL